MKNSIYLRLTRFLLPLAITTIVVEFGGQVLSAGMARVPQATETLAAYGLAWGLVLFLSSPLNHAKTLGLVLAEGAQNRTKVRTFILGVSLLSMGGLATLALTPVGYWAIEELHGVPSALGQNVRTVLLWLIPAPLFKGLALYYAGLLIRLRRTDLVSYANVASIGAGILLVFMLLPTPFIQTRPIWLPILATHLNFLVELGIVFWGYRRASDSAATIRGSISELRREDAEVLRDLDKPDDGTHARRLPFRRASRPTVPRPSSPLTFANILHFFWPLALIIMVQEFSRPLINLTIAQASDGPQALAVLTVAYVLGQFPYRWLNDIRSLATAFQDEPEGMHHIRRFARLCGLVSLGMMLGLFWTPLRDYILQTLMGLDADFAAQCRVPLMIFAGFSPVVTLRTYAQGIAFVEKRTQALVAGAPTRLAAIWLTLTLLPLYGVAGATLGVAALFAGFLVESLTVWWGVRGGWPMTKQSAALGTSGD